METRVDIYEKHLETKTNNNEYSFEASSRDTEEVSFLKRKILLCEEQNLLLKEDLANSRDEKERLEKVAAQNVDLAEEIFFTREALNKANDTLTQQQEELRLLAMTDTLTGAFNRRYLMQTLTELDKDGSANYAMLMIDIDHFKKVNDTLGHQAGDIALVAFASLCKELTPDDGVFGRLGGEEFAILLTNYSIDHAISFAETLRQSTANMRLSEGESEFSIKISIGVVECENGALSSKEMFRLTDEALYKAKANGRNCTIRAT